MRYEDFLHSPSGRLVPTIYDESAFVPHPLPPDIDLIGIIDAVVAARGALGELRGACRRLSNPYILIRPLQRLEAETSSAMEGTYTTSDALALAESGVETSDSAREVANYSRALSWAIQQLDELPISGRLLRGAHAQLLNRVGRQRGEDKRPGEFKRDQNMIGGYNLSTARFIPPPPGNTLDCIADLEMYINRDERTDAWSLIDLALVHYQFECIHPFADGNGRVGRMLITLMGISEDLLDGPVLYMSPELEKRKSEYIDLMYNVSSRGDWTQWICFFLAVLVASCKRTISTIDRVLVLQERYRREASNASRSSNILAVVDMLFETPAIRPTQIMERTGITDAAARNILRQLCELEIVTERTAYYPTMWVADGLLDIAVPE